MIHIGFTNHDGTIKYLVLKNNILFDELHMIKGKDSVTLEFDDGYVHFYVPGASFPGNPYYFVAPKYATSPKQAEFFNAFLSDAALDLFYTSDSPDSIFNMYTPLLPNCSVERKPK